MGFDVLFKMTKYIIQESKREAGITLLLCILLCAQFLKTIPGLTSKTDALQTSGSRMFQLNEATSSAYKSSAPFYYHESERYITVDFSVSIGGYENGSITYESVGKLDLAALLPTCPRCRYRKTIVSSLRYQSISLCKISQNIKVEKDNQKRTNISSDRDFESLV